MSTSNHPIIVPSDYDVEDAFFSTHSPDYTLASLDYFPASPGNTSSDPLDDLSKYLLALVAISPFHDDPYMKVMQAYNATSNELPIPLPQALIALPTVLPPSPVLPLSPMFDPQDFFLPEEILPPQKQARFLSSSSTNPSALPQLPLERIEHMEDKIEGLGNGRREKIRHDEEIVLARIRTSTLEILIEDIQNGSQEDINIRSTSHDLGRHQETSTEGVVGLIYWFERTESVFLRSNYTEDCKVKFATGTLTEEDLSWWNSFAQPFGIEEAYKITWSDLKIS
ncbi:hypothetical protein Tco_0005180 [Tanacetum coccineum]